MQKYIRGLIIVSFFILPVIVSAHTAQNSLEEVAISTIYSLEDAALDQALNEYKDNKNKSVFLHLTQALEAHQKYTGELLTSNPETAEELLLNDSSLKEKIPSELHKYLASKKEITGIVEIMHTDYFNKNSHANHLFINDEKTGERFRIIDTDEQIPLANKKIKISGISTGNILALDPSSAQTLSGISQATTPTQENIAVILLNFPNIPASPLTHIDASNIMSDIDSYFNEISYGKRRIAYSLFPQTGWYAASRPLDQTLCNDLYQLGLEAIAAADNNINFNNYSRVMIYMPSGNCAWGGIAYVGMGPQFATADGALNISISAVEVPYPPDASAAGSHELGHNFGLLHANFLNCGTSIISINPLSCFNIEYGDIFDVMGFAYNKGHLNAFHKNMLGLLETTNVRTITGVGTYILEPLEVAGTGAKALVLNRPDGQQLWLEYRQALGRDAVFSPQTLQGLLMHLNMPMGSGDTSLLDASPTNPESSSNAILGLGKSYADPSANITITPVGENINPTTGNTELTVQVSLIPQPPSLPTNLVLNSGFESGQASWSGWSTDETVVNSPFYKGARSLRLLDGSSTVRNIYQSIYVTAGDQYTISGYLKTSNIVTNQKARMVADWRNSAGNTIKKDYINSVSSALSSWTKKSTTLTAPVGTVKFRLYMELTPSPSNNGAAWFDEISVIKI